MKTGPSWSPPEVEFVNELAGQVPFPVLVRRFQLRAKQQGWPPRSANAIQKRLNRTRTHVRCTQGDWLTVGLVASFLGVSIDRVDAWLRRPYVRRILQPKWHGKVRYVERKAWRQLAKQMPRVLGGFTADSLFLLLEDRHLAEDVARHHQAPVGDWRIRCVETGRIFDSCSEVARCFPITQSAVSRAVRLGRSIPSIGLTFEPFRQPLYNDRDS